MMSVYESVGSSWLVVVRISINIVSRLYVESPRVVFPSVKLVACKLLPMWEVIFSKTG